MCGVVDLCVVRVLCVLVIFVGGLCMCFVRVLVYVGMFFFMLHSSDV